MAQFPRILQASLEGIWLTVTAPDTSLRRYQVPATQEGVDAQQMTESINVVNTEDALKYLPSLVVRKRRIGDQQAPLATRTSGLGQSARSLIYADNVLLSALIGNNNSFASPKWGMVAPEEIERIDVLYGPFAAQYQGNSIGAVVEIQSWNGLTSGASGSPTHPTVQLSATTADGNIVGVGDLAEQVEVGGEARHRSVVLQYFADHRRWLQSRQAREIAAGLRMPGTHQHATLLRHQREDMSRACEIGRLGRGIGEGTDGLRAIAGADAGDLAGDETSVTGAETDGGSARHGALQRDAGRRARRACGGGCAVHEQPGDGDGLARDRGRVGTG